MATDIANNPIRSSVTGIGISITGNAIPGVVVVGNVIKESAKRSVFAHPLNVARAARQQRRWRPIRSTTTAERGES